MEATQLGQKSTQINIRFNRDVKQRGEQAFRKAGFSASEATRVFWEWAAMQLDSPDGLRTFLKNASASAESSASVSEAERKTKAFQRACEQARSMEHYFDIYDVCLDGKLSDKELLAEAIAERYGESER